MKAEGLREFVAQGYSPPPWGKREAGVTPHTESRGREDRSLGTALHLYSPGSQTGGMVLPTINMDRPTSINIIKINPLKAQPKACLPEDSVRLIIATKSSRIITHAEWHDLYGLTLVIDVP